MSNLTIIIVAGLAIIGGLAFYGRSLMLLRIMENKEKETGRKMYELAILKELGDRIGYSLDVHEIIDIITGSLRQFIEYSAVSYMLIQPEKIIFKVQLERSVNRQFLNDIRDRMIGSLSALLDKELSKSAVEEVLSGAILSEDDNQPVRSFFNIPLVIGDKVVGVLTVSDTKSGLYKEEEMTILYKITQQASKAVSKLEEVVRMEQRKLNSMVESMADGIVMTDNDYRVFVANPAVKSLLGLNEKAEVTIFDFIDRLGGKFDIRSKLEESVKLSKIVEAPEVLLGERFFEIVVSPVRSSMALTSGEVLGGVVIFHDITREKELEKLREDFTSMMVHELRSPLDGINKIADLVISEKTPKEEEKLVREYMPIIYKSSADMLRLVSNLLDAAKVDSGKYQIFKEPAADIRKLVAERVRSYEPSAKAKQIKILPVIGADVPQNMSFDPNALVGVFNNFVFNAIKFTGEGGEINIQAFLHKSGADVLDEARSNDINWFIKAVGESFVGLPTSLVVAITDNGVGISQENLPFLFNKFRQFKTAALTADKKGTGLGLVIAKGIVEAHGGVVGADSDEGRGSTFYFTLPI
jgi:signal transduction histidine kinase